MLLTLLTVALITVAVCLLVIGLVVLPFVTALDLAERRGFSTLRWGTISLLGIALMLMVSYQLLSVGAPWPALLPTPVLGWGGPLALALLDPRQRRIGGTQGAHLR